MKKLGSIRRALRWHRRTFAALAAAVAVLAALNVVTQRSSEGTPVVIATRAVPAGQVIVADDLTTIAVPPAAAPEHALTDPEAAIGRSTITELTQRTVLTPGLLLDSEGAVPAGRLALPVRFSESEAVALLRIGGRVDILGAVADSEFGVVAESVRIVAIPTTTSSEVGASQAPLVLVEVDPTQAARIAAASSVSGLSFALH